MPDQKKRKQKFSGHGSMTKAGKVKFYTTPKVKRTGVNSRKKQIPRLRYKGLFHNRIELELYGGQPNSIGARKFKQELAKQKEALKKWGRRK